MPAGGEQPSVSPVADPWQPIVSELTTRLADRLSAVGPPVDPAAVAAQLGREGGAGWELAVPLHRWAKERKVPPPELASRIAEGFPSVEGIAGVFAAGAYVNFAADRPFLTRRTLDLVFARGDRYGHGNPSSRRACVEHTSANPTGPLHVGRIRNAIIGDTLARVLRGSGGPVRTQYYVDDLGRQAAMISWIWAKPRADWPAEAQASLEGVDQKAEKVDHLLGRPYPAVNEYLKTHPDADAEVQALAHALESGHAPPYHRATIERMLGGMTETLGKLGITFDAYVWESDLLADGSVDRVRDRLLKSPHAVQESNGAWAIDASSYGLPQAAARVIVTRGDGTTLYVTRDIAYHLRKFGEFDRVIDVLGSNHLLHAKTLTALLREVGESRTPEFVIYQYITAGGAGMATRKGTAVYVDDLLDEAVLRAREEVRRRHDDLSDGDVEAIARGIATGALRYHIVRVAAEKTVAFRWEDALSFEGRSGPFAQYSYVRASSILRKAESREDAPAFDPHALTTEAEWSLVRLISRCPGVVDYVGRTAHVHTLAGFAHELAEEFNRFYQQVPVLQAGTERASRLALVSAFRQTLGNVLDLLGLDRLERM
jgi:arginyl-tRNA synthetase